MRGEWRAKRSLFLLTGNMGMLDITLSSEANLMGQAA